MHDPRRLYYRRRPAGLLSRVATAVVAAGVLATAFFLGLFALAVLAGLALITAVVVSVRLWWARRWLARQTRHVRSNDRGPRPPDHDIVEGEFRVVSRPDRDPPHG